MKARRKVTYVQQRLYHVLLKDWLSRILDSISGSNFGLCSVLYPLKIRAFWSSNNSSWKLRTMPQSSSSWSSISNLPANPMFLPKGLPYPPNNLHFYCDLTAKSSSCLTWTFTTTSNSPSLFFIPERIFVSLLELNFSLILLLLYSGIMISIQPPWIIIVQYGSH